MERLYDGMGVAGTVIGALGGWKLVEWMLNRKANRRRAIADAVKVETDAFMARYNALEGEIKRLNQKVDELYKKVHALEGERLRLINENNELKLALKEAQHNVCVRPDDECLKRMPPRDYCRLVKLANHEYDVYYKQYKDETDGIHKEPDSGGDAR